MSRLAYSYATSILVAGPPSPNSKLRNGSGFVLRLPQGHWLGTAWHVVQAWQERQESGEEVQFQVGSAVLEPTADRVWVDRPNDIVFVPLEEDQVARIDATPISPSSWPPDLPKQGEYVLVAGFPGYLRAQPAEDQVELLGLGTILQIHAVGDGYLKCQFERENWISNDWDGVPSPGTDLGGIVPSPSKASMCSWPASLDTSARSRPRIRLNC